jgi:hypothetical protein
VRASEQADLAVDAARNARTAAQLDDADDIASIQAKQAKIAADQKALAAATTANAENVAEVAAAKNAATVAAKAENIDDVVDAAKAVDQAIDQIKAAENLADNAKTLKATANFGDDITDSAKALEKFNPPTPAQSDAIVAMQKAEDAASQAAASRKLLPTQFSDLPADALEAQKANILKSAEASAESAAAAKVADAGSDIGARTKAADAADDAADWEKIDVPPEVQRAVTSAEKSTATVARQETYWLRFRAYMGAKPPTEKKDALLVTQIVKLWKKEELSIGGFAVVSDRIIKANWGMVDVVQAGTAADAKAAAKVPAAALTATSDSKVNFCQQAGVAAADSSGGGGSKFIEFPKQVYSAMFEYEIEFVENSCKAFPNPTAMMAHLGKFIRKSLVSSAVGLLKLGTTAIGGVVSGVCALIGAADAEGCSSAGEGTTRTINNIGSGLGSIVPTVGSCIVAIFGSSDNCKKNASETDSIWKEVGSNFGF